MRNTLFIILLCLFIPLFFYCSSERLNPLVFINSNDDDNQNHCDSIIVFGENDTLIVSNFLFVDSGADGIGTIFDPLGSIQDALDSAVNDSTIKGINISVGVYQEAPVVRSRVKMYGGRDPGNNWRLSSSGKTVIEGNNENGPNIGMIIENIDDSVELRHVTIMAPDASFPGESSYGLYCINASDVIMVQCRVQSGDGGDSDNGTDGITPVDSVYSNIAIGGAGGHGGYEEGGYYTCDQWGCYWVCGIIHSPGPGEQGFCADGTQSGGESNTDGQDGENGSHGNGGSNLPYLTVFDEYPFVIIRPGENGTDGTAGCGGGGGSGAYASTCGHATGAAPGGGGGDGGCGGMPGTGGSGGSGGGNSIGIFAYQSNIALVYTTVYTGSGGRGGNGGRGGSGHSGEPGHEGLWDWNGSGSPGGDGGKGGVGGYGGGGAGGASVGIIYCRSNIEPGSIPPILGKPGLGGNCFVGQAESGFLSFFLELAG
jgi:hypothetical protein